MQRRAAEAAIGGRDVLVVAPTGFGKSAIYELAGLRRDRPWDVGAVVEHTEWGRGAVVGYERDLVTVQFDEHGYKTMQLGHVLEESLLVPAAAD